MRFKLDENLGRLARELLESAGHDVATVHGEGLCTASDDRVIHVARQEQRCLVTLDLEFGNPLRYRAADYAGIAILRLPAKPSPAHLENAVKTLIAGLEPKIARHLWTIEAGRIRIYQDPDEDPLEGRFEGDQED